MTSYQKLKEERDEWMRIATETLQKLTIVEGALWKIAQEKGPEVVEAPKIALQILATLKTNDTEEK